jgi:transcription initiation factor IIE alpha subunit
MTTTSFLCEICGTPLDDNENDIKVQKNKDRMQRLNS